MPYPHEFKQQTTVTVNDARTHVVAGQAAMIFKPLISVSVNGPQSLIVGHSLPNSAAIYLRSLVLLDASTPLVIRPGPGYWPENKVPSMVLSEDPNAEKWWWTDALPWTYAGRQLWSVIATKDPPASPPPPPPPPPATPIILGASAMLAAPVTFGTEYVATLAPFATGYAYTALATGTGDTLNVLAPSSASVGSTVYGGNHMGLPAVEGGPMTGTGAIVVAGGAHTGPDAVYSFTNPLPTAILVDFKPTSP